MRADRRLRSQRRSDRRGARAARSSPRSVVCDRPRAGVHGPPPAGLPDRSCRGSRRSARTDSRRRREAGRPHAARGERLEDDEERLRERFRDLDLARPIRRFVLEQRLGEPFADVLLTPCPGAPKLVDADSRDHGDQVRLGGGDRFGLLPRGLAAPAQIGLLDHVLGAPDLAEHPVGDPEELRAEGLEALVGHCPPASPASQLGCSGAHPSSRLAFALEAPRTSHIMITVASPAARRPIQRGR